MLSAVTMGNLSHRLFFEHGANEQKNGNKRPIKRKNGFFFVFDCYRFVFPW